MFKNNWLAFALALAFSLALHIGAALFFIISGSFRMAGENTHYFNIQEIELTPSISAPPKKPGVSTTCPTSRNAFANTNGSPGDSGSGTLTDIGIHG